MCLFLKYFNLTRLAANHSGCIKPPTLGIANESSLIRCKACIFRAVNELRSKLSFASVQTEPFYSVKNRLAKPTKVVIQIAVLARTLFFAALELSDAAGEEVSVGDTVPVLESDRSEDGVTGEICIEDMGSPEVLQALVYSNHDEELS